MIELETESTIDIAAASGPRPRVLLSAYACSPNQGSEAGTGWNRAVESAKRFDTWVICPGLYESVIRRHLEEHGEIPGLHFEFLHYSKLETRILKLPGLWMFRGYTVQNLWHRRALRLARRLHGTIGFDLVHHVTYNGYREPGYLWRLDAPFLWGPVGGTQNYPWRFLFGGGQPTSAQEVYRGLVNSLQIRFSPRVRKAVANSAGIIAANSTGEADFKRIHKVEPLRMLDVGINDLAPIRESRQQGPLRILWVGKFEYRKALYLLIEALSDLRGEIDYELRIVGGGRLEPNWRETAKQGGVECQWLGWLPRDETLKQYHWADVFAFTSLRDTSGTVFLESLSRSVPVICLDHQGAADVITDQCGIKIPVTTPEEAVQGFRDALITLYHDRAKLAQLSRGARVRAAHFLWSRQGEQMAEVYRKLIGQNTRSTK